MGTSRRDFLLATAAGATLAPLLGTSLSAAGPALAQAPGSRSETPRSRLSRGHRNLFNGDTCVFFYNPELWQPEDFVMKAGQGRTGTETLPVGGPFQAKAIHRYVETLRKSGVDTFVINANASRAWYPSKTVPTILEGYRRGDREFFRGHAVCAGVTEPDQIEGFLDRFESFFGLYQDLLDAGADWLAETSKACRRQKISPWVSIRMNDFHGAKNIDGSFFNHPLLRQPGMRLSRGAYSPTMRDPSYRTGLNFERQEVRDALFTQIKEVVEDYDFEGLELDWWRNPMCCEPHARAETVRMMSDRIREIRDLGEARATVRARHVDSRPDRHLRKSARSGLTVADFQ